MSCVVLLACYQGERFLKAQIDSLLNQSEQDFHILARDDMSTDGTLAILKKYPDKITILPAAKRLGVTDNFNALLEAAHADYIFFCDQDDVWEQNKIKNSLLKMKEHPTHLPLLLHTDLEIVDENLKPLHDSFWNFYGLNPEKGDSINHLLVQNHATGCTVLINKALRELAWPIPKSALMHDWWLSLTASFLGKIIFLREKTVRYRQHSANVLGAKQADLKKIFHFLINPAFNDVEALLQQKQAKTLHERYEKIIPQGKLTRLNVFLRSDEMSLLERKKAYITHRFFRQGLKKTIPYLFQNRPF